MTTSPRHDGSLPPAQETELATLHRAVVEQSQEGIFLAELETLGVLQANPAFLRMVGYTAEELAALPIFAFIAHPREEIEANARKILESGRHPLGLRTYRRKDGSLFPVEVSGTLIQWQGRQALLVVVRDIGEQRRKEQERLTHAERFQEVLNQSGDIVTLLDPEGVIQYESHSLTRITGWEPQDRVGRSALEHIHADDIPAVRAGLAEAFAGKGQRALVFRYQCKDGAWIHLESVGHPVKDAHGFCGLVITSRDVSERVAMERALRDSQARLREVQELGRLGHWSLDLRSRTLAWSEEVYRIFHRDPALGPPTFEAYQALFRPQDWALVKAHLDVALATGEPQSFDIPLHWPDGSVTWHRGLQQPILEEGVPVRMVGVVQDITERKLSEEAVLRSTQELQEAQALGSIGSWTMDFATSAVTWSPGMYRLFERDTDLPPLTAAEATPLFVDDQGQETIPLSMTQLLGGEEVVKEDVHLRLPNGRSRQVHSIVHLVKRLGLPVGLRGMMQDISERKAAEQALKESARVFRDLFEASPIPMALLQADDGVILRINASALALFGLGPEVVGTAYHHQAYVSQAERAKVLERLELEGSAQDVPVRMHTIHGLSQVLVSANRLVQEGRPCILLAYRDITAQGQREEAQRQSQKLESLGVLAGGIAHDFNNLLTAILGNLNLSQHVLPPDSPAQAFLRQMEAAVGKASDLSRQMLAYSGRGRFRVEPVDLGRLGQEMVHLLSVSISKRVRLTTDLPTGLGIVRGDPAQLQQVLLNLLTNASEAVGDRDGSIHLELSRGNLAPGDLRGLTQGTDVVPGPHLCLTVRDDGSGMTPEVLARIFDPFFTTKATGRGLGLSAMLGIIRGHKGGLAVDSVPGAGTTFRIYLPCTPQEQQAQAPPAPMPNRTLHGTVLLVDDEPPLRQGVALMLEHMGFRVVEAQDGVEALELATPDPQAFCCVILDLTMPRMDGIEALGRLRALRPDLPVLLSSGYSDGGEALPPEPGIAFLPKPYRMTDLREALVRLLGEGR